MCTEMDKKKKSGEPKAKDALDKLKVTHMKKYREKIKLVTSWKARRGATKQQQLWHHAQLTVVYIYYVRI